MLTVLTQKPLFSTGKPSDAHHLRHVQPRALGRKASDEFAVPLCRSHHRAVHRAGHERAWRQTAGVDPPSATVASTIALVRPRPLPEQSARPTDAPERSQVSAAAIMGFVLTQKRRPT